MNEKKPPTEGQALIMMLAILLGGTILINSIVYVLFFS